MFYPTKKQLSQFCALHNRVYDFGTGFVYDDDGFEVEVPLYFACNSKRKGYFFYFDGNAQTFELQEYCGAFGLLDYSNVVADCGFEGNLISNNA